MARYTEVKPPSNLMISSNRCFIVNGQISYEDVSRINSFDETIILIMANTKGQNSDALRMLDGKKVTISVVGGLDYLNKRKYSSDEYIDRTLIEPGSLAEIIKIIESIERKIVFSWTETQKCMFVYKTLCEKMSYAECVCSRSLSGLLYNRAVCHGLSLIFKEMMDRLGIQCLYQNIPNTHSWNAVKLDGDYYLLDLAWDINTREEQGRCTFAYFGMQDGKTLYSDPSHNITDVPEEIVVPAKAMSSEKIQDDLEVISRPKFLYTHNMKHHTNLKGEQFDYMYLGESSGLDIYAVVRDNAINYFYATKDDDIIKHLNDNALSSSCAYSEHCLGRAELTPSVKHLSRFTRNDGSSFIVCQTNKKLGGDVKEYFLIEPVVINGKKALKRCSVISESDLVGNKDADFKRVVADGLLSRERLERKVKYYNGYVGYVLGNSVYYDRQFETDKLGIQNRL